MRKVKNGKRNLTTSQWVNIQLPWSLIQLQAKRCLFKEERRRKILCIPYLQSVYLNCILMAPLSDSLSDSESQTLPICFIIVPLPKRMLQAFGYTRCESIPILNVDTIHTMQ
jgi:hypothetical protein